MSLVVTLMLRRAFRENLRQKVGAILAEDLRHSLRIVHIRMQGILLSSCRRPINQSAALCFRPKSSAAPPAPAATVAPMLPRNSRRFALAFIRLPPYTPKLLGGITRVRLRQTEVRNSLSGRPRHLLSSKDESPSVRFAAQLPGGVGSEDSNLSRSDLKIS